jgi:hypothetical protein
MVRRTITCCIAAKHKMHMQLASLDRKYGTLLDLQYMLSVLASYHAM